MYEIARITAYKVGQIGTELKILIPNKNLLDIFSAKKINKCELRFDDGRKISAEQRKKAYATIRDIAEHTGYLPEEQKEWLKYLHIEKTGCKYFSLSSCTMDTAREFISTILEYTLSESIMLNDYGMNRTDDINRYLYFCYKHKKCAICGLDGEIHHWDAIGMGNDRKKYDDSFNRKICLCRLHHTEAHSVGKENFSQKYKVYGIIIKG